MRLRDLLTGLPGINLCALKLALSHRTEAQAYISEIIRRYDEYAGLGLPQKDPIEWLATQDWVKRGPNDRVQLPAGLTETPGDTPLTDLCFLAGVTRLLQPKKIFEVGTFMGRTTSVLLMNAPAEATVYSLDLPPDSKQVEGEMIDFDYRLIKRRKLAAWVHELGLQKNFQQLLSDSLLFDPAPYRDSIELGFIDGAHSYQYVKNDTEKMAIMMSERGLVLWHDYGGKGRFRPLAAYLESLAEKAPFYRIAGTTLAWTTAANLKKACHA